MKISPSVLLLRLVQGGYCKVLLSGRCKAVWSEQTHVRRSEATASGLHSKSANASRFGPKSDGQLVIRIGACQAFRQNGAAAFFNSKKSAQAGLIVQFSADTRLVRARLTGPPFSDPNELPAVYRGAVGRRPAVLSAGAVSVSRQDKRRFLNRQAVFESSL